MPDCPENMHMVNAALIQMMQEARTWDQVTKAADAALHVGRMANSLRREHAMFAQDGAATKG